MAGCGLGAFRLLLALGFLVEQRLLHGFFPLVACGVFQLGLFRRWAQVCHLQYCGPTAEALLDKRAAVYLAGTGRMPQQFSTVADVLRQMCQRRIRVFFSKGRVAGFQRRHGTLGHITLKPTLVVKSLAGIPVGHRRDPPLQKNAGFPKKTSGDPAEMKMR